MTAAAVTMDRMIRYTVLGTIAGVILAFNMYHADYKLLVAQVGTIALIAMWLIQYTFPNVGLRKVSLVWNPGILFFAICILSFILSPHKLVSGQELYKVGTWIVFGMIVAASGKRQETRENLIGNITNVWLACAGIIAIYGIAQFLGFDFMRLRLPHHRIVSTFGNSTLLAGFLAMTLPVALARMLERKKAFSCQLSAVSLIILLLACLMLTRSRAGIFTAIFAMFILVLWHRKVAFKKALPIAAGVLAVILILVSIPAAQDVIFDILFRKTLRFDIWGDTLQLAGVNPFMGTGIGTFTLYFPKFVSGSILKSHFVGVEFVNHAHSEYLEVLSEMGILGLGAFLLAAGLIIYRFKKTYDSQELILKAFFMAFIAALLHNIVSVDLRYTSTGIFFWMIAGVLSNCGVIARANSGVIASEAKQSLEIVSSTASQSPRNDRKKNLFVMAIVIATVIAAIYFTVKPYMEIQKAGGQDFFAKDTGRIEGRIRDMETAGQEDPDYLFKMGVLYAKNKDFRKAKEYFIKTVKKDANHAGALNNLGNLALMDGYPGSVGRSRDLFFKAVRIEPDNAEYMVSLGYSYFMLNDMELAMKAVEKALIIEPDNSRALLLRRQMLQ